MARIGRYPPERVAAAEALVRGTERSLMALAGEIGVAPLTLRRWNRRFGWRATHASHAQGSKGSGSKARGHMPGPAWTPERVASLGRLYHNPTIDPRDLEAALSPSRWAARGFLRSHGLTVRRRAAAGRTMRREADGFAGPALRAALHAQVARQIVRFDAALREEPGLPDSARVLRDLGGLKRLLDDLDAAPPQRDGDGHATRRPGSDAQDVPAGREGAPLDLPALRAEIARRYAAFAGERASAGLPGEPAAPPPRGPGP
ncbi:hypothetical protein J2X36_004183 [Methylobacterium sp. BE186]|uniref:hypothetical protein n=1 Tax=Methylobacterium sp. BE186 TaxID=2817715 RepID=UPI0028626133|nr:hypothetical protein [Methylobacterium sp. BE186]MDR7039407.1 hypothetical protein [Methylobacterium sp. BE186]